MERDIVMEVRVSFVTLMCPDCTHYASNGDLVISVYYV